MSRVWGGVRHQERLILLLFLIGQSWSSCYGTVTTEGNLIRYLG